MDRYLDEKNSLDRFLASEILKSRRVTVASVIQGVEKSLGRVGSQRCDGFCACQKEGEDGLMKELDKIIGDGAKKET